MTAPLLAHAGAGATWQALLVVAALGLTLVVVLTVVDKVTLEQPDDLVLPLAGVAIGSSLAPLGSAWLSDWIGWAFPLGVVMLVTVLLTALTPLELTRRSPITYGAFALAIVSSASLYAPITRAWHPPPDFLPLAEDVEVAITAPADGEEVPAGTVEVTVTISDGSVQPDLLTFQQLQPDAEEAGYLAVAVDGEVVRAEFAEDCSIDAPCSEVTFPVRVAPGERRLVVEFRRGDGVPMTPLVTDAVTFTAR